MRLTFVLPIIILIIVATIQIQTITADTGTDTGKIVTLTQYLGVVDSVLYNTWINHLQAQSYGSIVIHLSYSPGSINTVICGNMYFRKKLVNPGYYVVTRVTTRTNGNQSMMYFEGYIQYLDNNTLEYIGNAEIIIRNTGNASTIVQAELSSNNRCLLKLLTYIINVFIASPLERQISIDDLIGAVGKTKTIIRSPINATFSLNGTINGLLQQNTTKLQSIGYELTYDAIYSSTANTTHDTGLDLQMLRELYILIENDTGSYSRYIVNIINNTIYYYNSLSLDIYWDSKYFDVHFSILSGNISLDHWNSMIYTILTANGYSYKSIDKLMSKLDVVEEDLSEGNLSGAEKILRSALGKPVLNVSYILANHQSMYKVWSNLTLAFNLISTQNGSLYILPDGRLINMTVKSIMVKPYPTPLDAVIMHMILNNRRVLPQIATRPKPPPAPSSPAGISTTTTSKENQMNSGENITATILLTPKPQLPKPTINNLDKHDLTLALIFLGVIGGIILIVYIDKRRNKNK